MGEIILPEGSTPSIPATGKVKLYAKTDGNLYQQDDAGLETNLSDTGSPFSDIATATATTTTTSTTFVLVAGMTITPAAGTYAVFFSTSLSSDLKDVTASVSIYAGGILRAASERDHFLSTITNKREIGTQSRVTVDGAQAIEARYKTTGGTLSAHQRNLMIIKVT